MTLQEVFENEELYLLKDKLALNNYLHNMKILQDEEIKENEEFKIILNENISELYEEHQVEGLYRQFGINKESLQRLLLSLQEEENHVLRAELNMGLDNILLRDDLTSLDILKLML